MKGSTFQVVEFQFSCGEKIYLGNVSGEKYGTMDLLWEGISLGYSSS